MKRYFGAGIEPHCEYCANGRLSRDGKSVLCAKHGAVPLGYNCRSYEYDPLLRKPRQAALMADYDPEDFKL